MKKFYLYISNCGHRVLKKCLPGLSWWVVNKIQKERR